MGPAKDLIARLWMRIKFIHSQYTMVARSAVKKAWGNEKVRFAVAFSLGTQTDNIEMAEKWWTWIEGAMAFI